MAKTARQIIMELTKPQMSPRPECYLGRGNSLSDLNPPLLEKIHAGINQGIGTDAARAFVRMVADLTSDASATTFLDALYRLEEAGWVYDKQNAPDGTKALQNALAESLQRREQLIPQLALADVLREPRGQKSFLKTASQVDASAITDEFLRAHTADLPKSGPPERYVEKEQERRTRKPPISLE